mgnify:CR=1 FL=1|tara:strand:+ start:2594 stop:2773 length:180 start_codon:yes stop_codon:yes gene_type:complete
MVSTGRYAPGTDEFDLQSEINLQIERLTMQYLDIDAVYDFGDDKKEMYKAMIEYLLKKI